MADKIGVDVGDDGRNINAGKNTEQNVSERSNGNVVNNYLDSNNPEPRKRHQNITLEERLDRLEIARNEGERARVAMERQIERIVSLLDGNPSYRLVGISDQLAIYIKANEDWKLATEKRIVELEEEKKEKKIVLTPSAAITTAVIAILFIIVIWLASHYLQNAGTKEAIRPIMPFILNITPSIIQGLYGRTQ